MNESRFAQWAAAEAAQGIQQPPIDRQSVWLQPGRSPAFALRVCGNSMIPTFYNGELVFVEPQQTFKDGQIAIVEIDGGRTMKRVYRVPGGLRLVPDNREYESVTIAADEVRIVGIAVARGTSNQTNIE